MMGKVNRGRIEGHGSILSAEPRALARPDNQIWKVLYDKAEVRQGLDVVQT